MAASSICDFFSRSFRKFHLAEGVDTRGLHGITDRGNPGITAVKTEVVGSGFSLLPRWWGNGESYLEISIEYHSKNAVFAVKGAISVVLAR